MLSGAVPFYRKNFRYFGRAAVCGATARNWAPSKGPVPEDLVSEGSSRCLAAKDFIVASVSRQLSLLAAQVGLLWDARLELVGALLVSELQDRPSTIDNRPIAP